jgi:hypothetical protein
MGLLASVRFNDFSVGDVLELSIDDGIALGQHECGSIELRYESKFKIQIQVRLFVPNQVAIRSLMFAMFHCY